MPIKCPNCTKSVLKNFWMPASFFFKHSKFGKELLCYISILHFSLSFMCDFILSLITKEVVQPKMIVMIFPEIDETNWTG